MTRPRLFPEPADTESRTPQKKFEEVASTVFSVSKDTIDEREKQWQREKQKPKP